MPLDSSWQSRVRLGLDEETESLNIITEPSLHSSSLARAFLSQLTTPRATPFLSPELAGSPPSRTSPGPSQAHRHLDLYNHHLHLLHL